METGSPLGGVGNVQGQPIIEHNVAPASNTKNDKGDDILLNNGEMVLRIVDLQIPGRGFPYLFTRCYKSRIRYHGTMGGNWDHNYNMRLMKERQTFGTLTGNIWFNDGLCHQELFVAEGGSFRSPLGSYNKLTGSNDNYDLRTPNGMVYHFVNKLPGESDRLFLDFITDKNGNTMTFQYDPFGFLLAVVDTLGRSIQYNYDPTSKRLVSVKDFNNREIKFSYDQTFREDLIQVVAPEVIGTSNGNDFNDANGKRKTTKYSYVPGFFLSGRLYNNLENMTMPNETAVNGAAVLTNSYNMNPNSYEFDKVTMQHYGGTNASGVEAGGTIHYFYQALNPGADPNDITIPRNRTTVIDRVGNVPSGGLSHLDVCGGDLRWRLGGFPRFRLGGDPNRGWGRVVWSTRRLASVCPPDDHQARQRNHGQPQQGEQ